MTSYSHRFVMDSHYQKNKTLVIFVLKLQEAYDKCQIVSKNESRFFIGHKKTSILFWSNKKDESNINLIFENNNLQYIEYI